MSDELREKAKAYLADANPSYSKEVEEDMPEVTYWMADFAAECIAAERERADRLKRECDNIYERLSWILSACTIDRDAKNEIEELLK